jgi:hypothetical protein
MIVQSTSASFFAAEIARSSSPRQNPFAPPTTIADTVRISQSARDALAASSSSAGTNNDKSVEARLAEIRAKGGVNTTPEEHDYLFTHDKRLAEITAQGKWDYQLTADELDYMQKATGMVNTFANLSPKEKALYDKAVASGNKEAAAGIGLIALVRMMGNTAGGANGTTYDPLNMEITAANIEKYFSHSIVDSDGTIKSKFQALIQFLQDNPVA